MCEKHFILSNSNSLKEFTFLTSDSWFRLIRTTITNPKITTADEDWSRLIGNCYLEIKLSHFADKERQIESSQHRPFRLISDDEETQPIIEFNSQINTEFISSKPDNFYKYLFIKLVQENPSNSELEVRLEFDEYQLK